MNKNAYLWYNESQEKYIFGHSGDQIHTPQEYGPYPQFLKTPQSLKGEMHVLLC